MSGTESHTMRAGLPAIAAALVLAVSCADPADAKPGAEVYARSGVQVAFGGVWALENFGLALVDTETPEIFPLDYSNTWGIDFGLGYRVSHRTSVELSYVGTFGFNALFPGGKTTTDLHLATINGRLYLTHGRFQPYFLIGMGALIEDRYVSFEGTNAGFAVVPGLGIDLYATENIAVQIEGSYVFGTGNVEGSDYGLVGASLLYRF